MTTRLGRISTGSAFEMEMAYSRAVVKGDWCFVSGVTGFDYETMTIPESAEDQTRQIFLTIKSVLTEAAFDMADIVRVQYTITDARPLPIIKPVLAEVFEDIRPAATMIVAGLIDPAMLIEVEVTAFRGT